MSTGTPQVTPGTAREIGRVNTAVTWLLGAATGGPPPNLFTTLARHRRLFRPWLRFAGGLMPGGTLPRDESELVILRVAHLTDCAYEWHHHERLGDELWARLSSEWSDTELIELCLLTGHYIMLAMTINSLGIQLDPAPDPQARRSPVARLIQTIAGGTILHAGAATSSTSPRRPDCSGCRGMPPTARASSACVASPRCCFQRKLAFPYELAMRRLNDHLVSVAEKG